MIYRFTGPPENWLTATYKKAWAFNENNKELWRRLEAGDIAIFHSTGKSDYAKAKSSVIGIGYIGEGMHQKSEYWWIQEKRDKEVHWPYVVPFTEMYFFSNPKEIDFTLDTLSKDPPTIAKEIESLLSFALPIAEMNDRAKAIDPSVPNFPVNGSASGINKVYEDLILDAVDNYYAPNTLQETHNVEERLSQSIDERIAGISDEILMREANAYSPPKENYKEVDLKKRVRKESQKQKRIVAKLYNYSCQICGFRVEYKRKNGTVGYIIEIDHIKDKALGGDERLKNLWALCPNCHKKKTRGVITIDVDTQTIEENGEKIAITDNHLFT
tara:strand:+ start:131 stop:1114 length:984 start_codon:yes stop_codon:yes gene_type:complete